jgi:hypothetical protein
MGLPSDIYWTGTESSAFKGYSWIVDSADGKVDVVNGIQGYGGRVVCVP